MPELVATYRAFEALATEILGQGQTLRFQAKGACMRPFVRDGDVVEVEPIGESSIRRGDVVLFREAEDRVLVHRVIQLGPRDRPDGLLTKGDAVVHPDEPVVRDRVLGRVVAVERGARRVRLDSRASRLLGLVCGARRPLVWRLGGCARALVGWLHRQGCSRARGTDVRVA